MDRSERDESKSVRYMKRVWDDYYERPEIRSRKYLPVYYVEPDHSEYVRRFALWVLIAGGLALCALPAIIYRGPW